MTYNVLDMALGASLMIGLQLGAGFFLLWLGLSGRRRCDESEER
jgi:membrane protein implicated in regulation of membrane protease activity